MSALSPVVVVSGPPRSGTSLLMQMLRAGGLPLLSDGQRLPDASNRGGYLEHRRVRRLGADPAVADWLARWAPGRGVKVVHALLGALPHGPGLRYRVLLLDRPLLEVVASQDRMLARAGEAHGTAEDLPAERLAEVFAAQLEAVRRELAGRADCRVLEISFRRLLAEPHRVAEEIARFLEGAVCPERMAGVVDLRRVHEGAPERYTAPMADDRFDDLDLARLRRRTGEKWQLYPPDVLPLWVADMDFEPAGPIRERLQQCLDLGDLGYPKHPLPTGLPEIFAERAKRVWGWEVEPALVELLTEVVQGLYVAIRQFSRPGEGVIVQTPIYPPFLHAVKDLGRRRADQPLRAGESGYEVDLDGLDAAAREARILMLCNPHNPTGRAFRSDELEAMAEIAVRHDLVVLSDEIHADLVHRGSRHIPIATISPEIAQRTVTFTSASKAFNIAGLRCAVAIFGSSALRRRFLELPRHLRGGLGGLGIQATEVAWTQGDPWLRDLRGYLEANRDFLAESLRRELPEVRFFPPEATYLAWLDFRPLGLEPSSHRYLLDHARVALSDGAAFGPPGEGFVRLNFATSRPILTAALDRIFDSLRR